MNLGEDITFQEFLQRLGLSNELYVKAIRSSLTSTTVFLKRSPLEIRVNAYNIHLLRAWRANLDIQFVLNVYACAKYVASYVTKDQKGMSQLLRKSTEEAKFKNGGNIRQQFRLVANRFLNSVELSAQEAAYIILQLPMKKASRVVVFINTNFPQDRIILLKPQHVLDRMDDDDDNVETSTLIKQYQDRPAMLESTTLAEFACCYNKSAAKHALNRPPIKQSVDGFLPETKDDDNLEDEPLDAVNPDASHPGQSSTVAYTLRQVPRILRCCHFDKETQPEKYYHELLMLYIPWRDESVDLLGEYTTYEESYEQVSSTIEEVRLLYEPFASDVDHAISELENENHQQDSWDKLAPGTEHQEAKDKQSNESSNEQGQNVPPESNDLGGDLGLSTQITNLDEFQTNNEMRDEEYREALRTLNKKQMEFLYEILHHVKTSTDPIYRFLSGGAGVGKTHLSNLLYQSLLKYLNKQAGSDPDQPHIMLLAPTGKAAYLLKVQTLHSALKIPPNQSLKFTHLDADRLNTLRLNFFSLMKYQW